MTQRTSVRRFDQDAMLAGSAEVYISNRGTTPPALGYPITQSRASTLEDAGTAATKSDKVYIWPGAGSDILGGIGAKGQDKAPSSPVAPAAANATVFGSASDGMHLSDLEFVTHGPKPTLKATLKSTVFTELDEVKLGSLYIQVFGRTAEFIIKDATSTVDGDSITAGTSVSFEWALDNNTNDDIEKLYTLYQISTGRLFTVQGAKAGGQDKVDGFNSLWSRYGDGLISRDAIGLEQTQEIERLRIAAVLPAIKLYRQETSAILTFTCFSVSPEFVARIMGGSVQSVAGTGSQPGPKGVAAYDQVAPSLGVDVEEFAICVRMDDAPNENGKMSQVILPTAGITGNVRVPLARTPQGTEVTVEALYSPVWDGNFIYQTQTDTFVYTV